MLNAAILDELKALLGPRGWADAVEDNPALRDIHGPGLPALLLARPESTDQVAALMRFCAQHQIAVVPQGGNTNLCRMALPTVARPTVLLSLARMNRVLEINPEAATLTAEAGCVLEVAQEAARAAGFILSPDWGARGTASLGGAVATNGGGLNVVRYGTTREQVMGMEVVLADGTVWDGMRSLVKDNSGYDLRQIFIGSEGTLGVITKLIFRLHPAEPESRTMMAALADLSGLMDFFGKARRIGGTNLSAFELMPGIGVEKALARYPDLRRPLEAPSDWYVLVRFSGREAVEDLLAELFEAGFEAGLLTDAVLASSETQARNLWEIREQMIPHQYFPGQVMLKWDVSLPIDRMAGFLAQAEDTIRSLAPQGLCYAVGHVGDGNLHFSCFLPTGTDETTQHAVYDTVDALIWRLGGSIVAEHGVGALFRDRVARQKSAVEYAMLQCLKAAFDPEGRLNPGKLLHPPA